MTHLSEQDIALYVIGAHDEVSPEAVETHLAACTTCAIEAEKQAQLELTLVDLSQSIHCPGCRRPIHSLRCGHCGAAAWAGEYRVIRVLVQTQRGRLYLAVGAQGEHVALKELVFTQVPSFGTVDAFEREGRLLGELRHARIPRFVKSFAEGEGVSTRLYLAQELVDGCSLLDKLKTHRFTEGEILDVARQLLETLAYLQALSPPVFHRDIKPANLIQRPDGTIVLVDFGSARDHGPTVGATMAGTYGYSPPEQFVGIVDATSDLYALGASLSHLLSRKPPWQVFETGFERAKMNVSKSTLAFLQKLTAPKPADRYPNATAALTGLDGLERGPQISPKKWIALAMIAAATGAGGTALIHRMVSPDDVAPAPLEAKVVPQPTPAPAPVAEAHGSPSISEWPAANSGPIHRGNDPRAAIERVHWDGQSFKPLLGRGIEVSLRSEAELGSPNRVSDAVIDRAGRFIALVDDGQTARLWAWSIEEERRLGPIPPSIPSVRTMGPALLAYDGNQYYLAFNRGSISELSVPGGIYRFDLDTNTMKLAGPGVDGAINSIQVPAFDRSHLYVTGDRRTLVYSLSDGNQSPYGRWFEIEGVDLVRALIVSRSQIIAEILSVDPEPQYATVLLDRNKRTVETVFDGQRMGELMLDPRDGKLLRYDAKTHRIHGVEIGALEETHRAPHVAKPPPSAAVHAVREKAVKAREFADKGTRLLLAGDLRGAEKQLTGCIALAEIPDCYRSLGVLYANLKDTERSIKHYKKYIELRPDSSDAPQIRQWINDPESQR
jgi:serine/threonine protein kinase